MDFDNSNILTKISMTTANAVIRQIVDDSGEPRQGF